MNRGADVPLQPTESERLEASATTGLVEPMLGDHLSFAAINGESLCVASGPVTLGRPAGRGDPFSVPAGAAGGVH